MKIKDCLFGQVRALDRRPEWIPPSLQPYIVEQQAITWDNATGMNPLWDQSPVANTMYKSYGEMLKTMCNWSKKLYLTYVKDLAGEMTIEDYNTFLATDHANDLAMLAWTLGPWYHINLFLNQPDALDYDYLILRQLNTSLEKTHTLKRHQIFTESRTQVFGEKCKTPYDDIPTIFMGGWKEDNYPIFPLPHSYYYVLNRKAVEVLRVNFMEYLLREVEYYYKTVGKESSVIGGKSGTLMSNIATKNNIAMIDIGDKLVTLPLDRSPKCNDWGRAERCSP